MTRKLFLTSVSAVGFTVAAVALALPASLLASKGVTPDAPVVLWLRELGVLIFALSVMGMAVRGEPDSRALRMILVANAIVHAGLFPIEIAGYLRGTLTQLSGIVPNSIFHVLAAAGFAYFAIALKAR